MVYKVLSVGWVVRGIFAVARSLWQSMVVIECSVVVVQLGKAPAMREAESLQINVICLDSHRLYCSRTLAQRSDFLIGLDRRGAALAQLSASNSNPLISAASFTHAPSAEPSAP